MRKGLFITFEGTEGSGKSTHIRAAASYFRRKGKRVLILREPGSTRVSEAIRRILLDPKHKGMSKETELLLYLAARAQLVREKIIPALRAGQVVISDRYEDSTLAYQGFGDGIPLNRIESISTFVRGYLKPDLTFVLDINPTIGLRRGGRHDRVEKKSDAFHVRVRRGFLAIARKNRARAVLVDALKPLAQVRAVIAKELHAKFK